MALYPLPKQPITDAMAVELATIRKAHYDFLKVTDKQACNLLDQLQAVEISRTLFSSHLRLFSLHFECRQPYEIYQYLFENMLHMPDFHHRALRRWLVDLFLGGMIVDLASTVTYLVDSQFIIADSRRWHGYPSQYTRDYFAEKRRIKS